jgi:hypothetical protein
MHLHFPPSIFAKNGVTGSDELAMPRGQLYKAQYVRAGVRAGMREHARMHMSVYTRRMCVGERERERECTKRKRERARAREQASEREQCVRKVRVVWRVSRAL